ncbi:Uncharacterised protein [Serratia proteamaculans]|nr:Uncharacterised protein [Serratia proteamaculans]
MVIVKLVEVIHDFHAFLYTRDNQTELCIRAHGWQNKIIRDGVYLDAFELSKIIKGWKERYDRLCIVSCYSTFLEPSNLSRRLSDTNHSYQNTLGCWLSRHIPNVNVISFIGTVISNYDMKQVWDMYNDPFLGKDLLEFLLRDFRIRSTPSMNDLDSNPLRFVQFRNGLPFSQWGRTITINGNTYAQL